MLDQYKRDKFLKAYKGLSLNERINTKYQDYRAFAYSIKNEFNDSYLVWLLPRLDQKLNSESYL